MKSSKIFAIVLAATAVSASAQQTLTGEVTVNRSVTPVEREASRLNLLPAVSLPAVSKPGLTYSSRAVTTPVAPMAAAVEPPARVDSAAMARRGYVDLGVFPLFNVDLSAGYRVLAKPRTSLDAWMQYNGSVFRAAYPGDDHKSYWRDHSVAVGANAVHDLGRYGMLSGSASYNFARVNGFAPKPYWVNSNRVDLEGTWSRSSDAATLRADLAYGYFGYNPIGIPAPDNRRGARDNRFSISGLGEVPIDEHSYLGAELGIDLLGTSKHFVSDYAGDYLARDGSTTGVVSVTPHYRYSKNNFEVSVGPRLEFTFNGGKAFHIAPWAKGSWSAPSRLFVVGLELGGGEHFNSLASLYDDVRRSVPFLAYGMSHIPLTVDADVILGPIKGAWVRIFGGWARANSWLMPALPAAAMTAVEFRPEDIKGFHGGVELGASWRQLVKATVAWHAASSDPGKGYYLWRDRARHVINANVTVTPIANFDFEASYELRACRSLYTTTVLPLPDGVGTVTTVAKTNLHNISQLNAGVRYRYTPELHFFIRGENLINHRSLRLDATPSQRMTALVGATYLF